MRDALFQTRITELFGIRHPILAGGLMWLSDANYVAAVVNAGGMGFITAKTFPDFTDFEAELDKASRLTGGKPFGVNLYMSVRPEQNADLPAQLEIALDKGVRHFETAGLPPAHLVERIKDSGAVVMHKVATVKHAISATSKLPLDAIAVVGAECGGHPGLNLVGSIVQAPLAVSRVSIPVVIGGGIGTGGQIAGLLAMGAEGVLLGTRFLVASEIWSHDRIKQRVVEADETQTALGAGLHAQHLPGDRQRDHPRNRGPRSSGRHRFRGLPSLCDGDGPERGLHRGRSREGHPVDGSGLRVRRPDRAGRGDHGPADRRGGVGGRTAGWSGRRGRESGGVGRHVPLLTLTQFIALSLSKGAAWSVALTRGSTGSPR